MFTTVTMFYTKLQGIKMNITKLQGIKNNTTKLQGIKMEITVKVKMFFYTITGNYFNFYRVTVN